MHPTRVRGEVTQINQKLGKIFSMLSGDKRYGEKIKQGGSGVLRLGRVGLGIATKHRVSGNPNYKGEI